MSEERPNGNGLSVQGPAGFRLWASGREVVLILVLLGGFTALGWIMDRGFKTLETAQATVLAEFIGARTEHRAIESAQRDLACIFALPPGESRAAAVADPLGICHYVTTVYLYDGRRR